MTWVYVYCFVVMVLMPSIVLFQWYKGLGPFKPKQVPIVVPAAIARARAQRAKELEDQKKADYLLELLKNEFLAEGVAEATGSVLLDNGRSHFLLRVSRDPSKTMRVTDSYRNKLDPQVLKEILEGLYTGEFLRGFTVTSTRTPLESEEGWVSMAEPTEPDKDHLKLGKMIDKLAKVPTATLPKPPNPETVLG